MDTDEILRKTELQVQRQVAWIYSFTTPLVSAATDATCSLGPILPPINSETRWNLIRPIFTEYLFVFGHLATRATPDFIDVPKARAIYENMKISFAGTIVELYKNRLSDSDCIRYKLELETGCNARNSEYWSCAKIFDENDIYSRATVLGSFSNMVYSFTKHPDRERAGFLILNAVYTRLESVQDVKVYADAQSIDFVIAR